MRTRISNKVNVKEVVSNIDTRRKAYTQAIQSIMANGVSYHQAKEQLKKQLRFKSFQRELNNI